MRVLPTGLSRGPWSPDALHGGPVAAIVARAGERLFARTFDGPYLVTRFTLDLERPVPLEPLTVAASVVRPGRNVQVADVTITGPDGRRLCRASLLAIRRADIALPANLVAPDDPPPPAPSTAVSRTSDWGFPTAEVAFHADATEHVLVRGDLGRAGPVTDWIRLVVPVVAGEEPGPLARAAAASDFLNGVSWTLPATDWVFINPDLTLTLHRLPVGEHIGVDAVTRVDPGGTGTAEADLYDTRGRIGRAVQTLLVQQR